MNILYKELKTSLAYYQKQLPIEQQQIIILTKHNELQESKITLKLVQNRKVFLLFLLLLLFIIFRHGKNFRYDAAAELSMGQIPTEQNNHQRQTVANKLGEINE